MNLEKQKEHFKNHVAKFTDYGNIKILDFGELHSSNYRIRFLFEEDYYRLHISGDLGELIATNYNNMTFEKFSDFVNNIEYFKQKIDCSSRALEYFDREEARKELRELFAEYEDAVEELMANRCDFETTEDVINDILEDFNEERGIGSQGYEELEKGFDDVWELTSSIGKRDTEILELYMTAFKLATQQLEN